MPCAVTADGIWLCGPKVQQCAWCGRAADYCCDFPVGEGRTCDLPLCDQHRMLQWEPQTFEIVWGGLSTPHLLQTQISPLGASMQASRTTNYVSEMREKLADRMPGMEDDLLDLYALLAHVKGPLVSNEDVHDAWAVWRNRTMPEHRSLIPFDELAPDVQALDTEYRDAIRAAWLDWSADCTKQPSRAEVSGGDGNGAL